MPGEKALDSFHCHGLSRPGGRCHSLRGLIDAGSICPSKYKAYGAQIREEKGSFSQIGEIVCDRQKLQKEHEGCCHRDFGRRAAASQIQARQSRPLPLPRLSYSVQAPRKLSSEAVPAQFIRRGGRWTDDRLAGGWPVAGPRRNLG